MFVPKPPSLTQLAHITASIYDASFDCLAKSVWYAFGGRGVLPEHPAAILGTSFHTVVAAAHRGELAVAANSDREPARQLFDATARALYSKAHPLIKLKFVAPERLPFYNMHRERAGLIAARIGLPRVPAGNFSTGAKVATAMLFSQTESRLCSVDGLIIGRPDHLDVQSQTVVDYKSGYMAEADSVSDSEARQLRLYAYLAIENGILIKKGVIIRGDGRYCELPISWADAQAEASNARHRLQMLNSAIGAGAKFSNLASPSSQKCGLCSCIPFCDSFWAAARPEWLSECGSHGEGRVLEAQTSQVHGVSLTTLIISTGRGTLSSRHMSVEQIPSAWMTLDGGDLPQPGELIRVVHGRLSGTEGSALVIRVDKVMTAIWHLPSEELASQAQ